MFIQERPCSVFKKIDPFVQSCRPVVRGNTSSKPPDPPPPPHPLVLLCNVLAQRSERTLRRALGPLRDAVDSRRGVMEHKGLVRGREAHSARDDLGAVPEDLVAARDLVHLPVPTHDSESVPLEGKPVAEKTRGGGARTGKLLSNMHLAGPNVLMQKE